MSMLGDIGKSMAKAVSTTTSAVGGGKPAKEPSGDAADGAKETTTKPRAVSKEAGKAAKKGAEHVEKGTQANADATRAKSAGERREARAEAPPEVKPENALANQAADGNSGSKVAPQRTDSDDPNVEDGESLVESAKAQARAQGRDGKIDVGAFRAMLNGETTLEGKERTALNSTSLVALSEELHQEADDLAAGAAPIVERAEYDPASMTPDEQVSALSQLYMREGILQAEDETLDVLQKGDVAQGNHRSIDAVDGDGKLDSKDTHVAGLDEADVLARREEIARELADNEASIATVIASMSQNDIDVVGTFTKMIDEGEVDDPASTLDDVDGNAIDVAVDKQVLSRITADHKAFAATGAPLADDVDAPAADTDGTSAPRDGYEAIEFQTEFARATGIDASSAEANEARETFQGMTIAEQDSVLDLFGSIRAGGTTVSVEDATTAIGLIQGEAVEQQHNIVDFLQLDDASRQRAVQFFQDFAQLDEAGQQRTIEYFEALEATEAGGQSVDQPASTPSSEPSAGLPDPSSITVTMESVDDASGDTVLTIGDVSGIAIDGDLWVGAGQSRSGQPEYVRTAEPVTIESPTLGTFQAIIQYDVLTGRYSIHEVVAPEAAGQATA